MKAMILAAGRGKRMQPLTDRTPKPLLQIGKHRLIEYHLFNLKKSGFTDIIINVAWLGQHIIDFLGDGSNYNLNIFYSNEGTQALETGGGIFNALPLLGDDPFLVINGDIWTDYSYPNIKNLNPEDLAHLVMINNPEHNPDGDFYLSESRLVTTGEKKYTFSGIGVYRKDFFDGPTEEKFPLAPIIRNHIKSNQISAELYTGEWHDIGTVKRLEELIQKQAL